jgi:hypothetical protein
MTTARAASGWIGENVSSTTATFAPNSEIWTGEKGHNTKYLVSMVGFYGVAVKQHAQKMELILGIGLVGHFDTYGAFGGHYAKICLALPRLLA